MLTEVEEEVLMRRRAFLAAHDFPADEFPDSDVLQSPAWIQWRGVFVPLMGWRITRARTDVERVGFGPYVGANLRSFELDAVLTDVEFLAEYVRREYPDIPDGSYVEVVAFVEPGAGVHLPRAIGLRSRWLASSGPGMSLSLRSHGPFTVEPT